MTLALPAPRPSLIALRRRANRRALPLLPVVAAMAMGTGACGPRSRADPTTSTQASSGAEGPATGGIGAPAPAPGTPSASPPPSP